MLRNVVCLGRYLSYVCVGRGSNWKCCRSELYITFYFIFIILSSVINHNVARDITSSLFLVDSPVTQVTYHLGGGGEKCSTCPRFILVCCQLPMPTFSDTLNFHHMNELISILFLSYSLLASRSVQSWSVTSWRHQSCWSISPSKWIELNSALFAFHFDFLLEMGKTLLIA